MWRAVNIPNIGLLGKIDETIRKSQSHGMVNIPDFDITDRLLIISDYSGQDKSSDYESYSFLALGYDAWQEWEVYRKRIRSRLDLTRRRISYKRMRDRQRQRVFPLLLDAAGNIEGFSITFVIRKNCGSLIGTPEFTAYQREKIFHNKWKPKVFEQAVRITTFIAFLLAGLSVPNQDVFWVSDEDAIAHSPEQLELLTEMLAVISSNLLPHNMRHLRCGTTAIDDGSLQLEDLASIPDLIAGSTAALHTGYASEGITLGPIIASAPSSLGWRAHTVLDWLSDPRLSLTRLVLLIEPEITGDGLSVKQLHIHGTAT